MGKLADPLREFVRMKSPRAESEFTHVAMIRGENIDKLMSIADQIDAEHERRMEQGKRTVPRKRALIIYSASSMYGCCPCGRWLEVAKMQRFCPECGAELMWRRI